jgi:hypothetical protein
MSGRHVDTQLPATFADQYGSAWDFASGYDVRRHVAATLIRLPITAPAATASPGDGSGATKGGVSERACALGWCGPSLAAVQRGLSQWLPHAGRGLLFAHKLQARMVVTVVAS